MASKIVVAIAAAVVVGAIASAGPAKAMPLAPAAQSHVQLDHSMVVLVKKHKSRHRHGSHRPHVSFGVTIPGPVYPGGFYHPNFYIDVGAPYHCHSWTNHFGLLQQTCHRHW